MIQMTKSQLIDALKDQQLTLADIPLNQRCEVLFRVAFSYDPNAWSLIPEQYKTQEVLTRWIAFAQSRAVGMYKNLPEVYKTFEFYTQLLKLGGLDERFFPAIFKRALNRFSDQQLDEMLAINPDLIVLLNNKRLTEQRCLNALDKSSVLIDDVPKKFKTHDFYLNQLIRGNLYLEDVPQHMMTDQIIETAVKYRALRGPELAYIPSALVTRELSEEIALKRPSNICYVPKKYLTVELCVAALDDEFIDNFEETNIFDAIPEAIAEEVRSKANFEVEYMDGCCVDPLDHGKYIF